MATKRDAEIIPMTVDVLPRQPRLVYRGMDSREEVKPVVPQIVEIVDPGHMTVFEGGHLLYAHQTRDGGIPCDGNGEPLLAPDPDGNLRYTPRAVELLTPERRRQYLDRMRGKKP